MVARVVLAASHERPGNVDGRFPLMKPTTWATEYFGGIERSMCM